MAIGTVKWFNNAKGYGFILLDGEGDDLFAHYSSIEMDGYKTLKAGQSVQFEIVEGPKGLQATHIQSVGYEEAAIEPQEFETNGELQTNGASATSEVISVTVEDAATAVHLMDDDHIPPKASHSN